MHPKARLVSGDLGRRTIHRYGLPVPVAGRSMFLLMAGALAMALPGLREPRALAGGTDVLTYHNDNARTGQNLN
jgi:hypothetical protein